MATYRKIDNDGELVEISAPPLPAEPDDGIIYTNADGKLCRFNGRRVVLVSPAELD